MADLNSHIRWKRVVWTLALLAIATGFVVGQPLLFPKPLPPAPPVARTVEQIEGMDYFFEQEGTPSLYYQCDSQHGDAMQMVIQLAFGGSTLIMLHDHRIEAKVRTFSRSAPSGGSEASSFKLLNSSDFQALWPLLDRVTATKAKDSQYGQIDGLNVTMEICRHGKYDVSRAITREQGPHEAAVFDAGIRLTQLAGVENWLR